MGSGSPGGDGDSDPDCKELAMELAILTSASAPADSRPLLEGIASDLGFVPNMAGTMALSPALLSAFDALRRVVGDETFNPVHREIAGVAVGVAVDNAYGVAFHSTVLSRLGIDDAEIEAMRAGKEPTDPTHAAVYAFARAVAVDRGAVDDEVIDRALAAGLDGTDLLQLVAECVFAGLVGVVDNLAGRVVLDEFLLRWAWNT
jgi:alkylhydroperoxidase family enzyme